jgi:hypothetical protein
MLGVEVGDELGDLAERLVGRLVGDVGDPDGDEGNWSLVSHLVTGWEVCLSWALLQFSRLV